MISFAAGPAFAVGVEAVLVDGTRFSGDWLRGSDHTVELLAEDGAKPIRLVDLTELRFQSEQMNAAGDAHLYLADGGQLQGRLLPGGDDSVVVRTTVFERLILRFDRLAGLYWTRDGTTGRAGRLFHDAMQERLPAEDVLIARSTEGAQALRGRLERLDPDGGSFVLGGRARAFRAEKVFGVVFAAGARETPSYPVRATLADGTVFSGRIKRADRTTLWMDGSLGDDLAVPISAIAHLALDSPRLTYLSDLRPVEKSVEGRLHHPWPIRYDRNVSAGTMAMGGTEFAKGIGVHSRTVLTFDVGRKYERFLAAVGIDDSVRPRGSVIFRVHAPDRRLFDSGEVRGTGDPLDVSIDITGVERLTLEVDYGESWDLADHANWAAARLVKPSEETAP